MNIFKLASTSTITNFEDVPVIKLSDLSAMNTGTTSRKSVARLSPDVVEQLLLSRSKNSKITKTISKKVKQSFEIFGGVDYHATIIVNFIQGKPYLLDGINVLKLMMTKYPDLIVTLHLNVTAETVLNMNDAKGRTAANMQQISMGQHGAINMPKSVSNLLNPMFTCIHNANAVELGEGVAQFYDDHRKKIDGFVELKASFDKEFKIDSKHQNIYVGLLVVSLLQRGLTVDDDEYCGDILDDVRLFLYDTFKTNPKTHPSSCRRLFKTHNMNIKDTHPCLSQMSKYLLAETFYCFDAWRSNRELSDRKVPQNFRDFWDSGKYERYMKLKSTIVSMNGIKGGMISLDIVLDKYTIKK
jgi:hypothetical protein